MHIFLYTHTHTLTHTLGFTKVVNKSLFYHCLLRNSSKFPSTQLSLKVAFST